METDLLVISSKRTSPLCYKCRRISRKTVFAPGGYYHSDRLEDVAVSASTCSMCRSICMGISTAIVDDHNSTEDEESVIILPQPWDVSNPSRRTGLIARYLPTNVTCSFNWYLTMEEEISSPKRPEGIQKLYAAKEWLNQSLKHPKSSFDISEDFCPNIFHRKKRIKAHPAASTSKSSPTRLLDLGDQSKSPPSSIRLVSYQRNVSYFALSHRWGRSQNLTTTSSNYLRHMLEIPFQNLPKTFQDAAMVTKFLGFRYLWIDALCIIQDDKIDWHREALLMGKVYRDANCVIAVHDAHDDSAGFLESSLLPPEVVALGSAPFGVHSTVSLRSDFKAEVDRSGLSRRGWVLQERFLSSRTLHFTAKSMFFEDERGVVTEEDAFDDAILSFEALSTLPGPTLPMLSSSVAIPVAIGDGSSTALQTRGERALADRNSWMKPQNWTQRMYRIAPFNLSARFADQGVFGSLKHQWFELLERYCKAELTYEMDKFPAISGLVKAFQEYTEDRFIAGIWEHTAHIGLLWTAIDTPLKRPRKERAASWSWASIDGPIQHPSQLELFASAYTHVESGVVAEGGFVDGIHRLIITTRMKKLSGLVPATQGESCRHFRRPVNLQVMKGSRKHKPLIYFSPEMIEQERRRQKEFVNTTIGHAVLDDAQVTDAEIYCLDIASLAHSRQRWVLLVTLSPWYSKVWCRVGVGVMDLDDNEIDWFEGVPLHKVVLG